MLFQLVDDDSYTCIQLPLPNSVTERRYHSVSAIQLSPHSVLLVVFGGLKSLDSVKLSHTVLIELSERYKKISYSPHRWNLDTPLGRIDAYSLTKYSPENVVTDVQTA